MISFFKTSTGSYYAVETENALSGQDIEKLVWLFDGATPLGCAAIDGDFTGPRREMITPWSTNAVEITQNMGNLKFDISKNLDNEQVEQSVTNSTINYDNFKQEVDKKKEKIYKSKEEEQELISLEKAMAQKHRKKEKTEEVQTEVKKKNDARANYLGDSIKVLDKIIKLEYKSYFV